MLDEVLCIRLYTHMLHVFFFLLCWLNLTDQSIYTETSHYFENVGNLGKKELA